MPFISIFAAVACSGIDNDQQRLANSIFKNYNKKLRPVTNATEVTNVTLNPALYSIVQTDEAAESITLTQFFRMIWKDDSFTWNISDYGGMKELLIPITEIWYPDINVDNTININALVSAGKNYAVINHDGRVLIELFQILTMHCRFDIIMFPFDMQNCTMSIGSWACDASRMDIFYKTPIDTNYYQTSSEWDFISMTTRKSTACYGDSSVPYVNVYYDIVIQRKPTYYLLTFVLPCFMITTISIIGIFAPFNDAGDREEKVTMGLTTLLTMTIILTLIADKMPKSNGGMPLLGTYIMFEIAIGAVTSLVAVIVMYQNRKWTTGRPVPDWILTVTRMNSSTKDKKSEKETKNASFRVQHYNIDEIRNYDGKAFTHIIKRQLHTNIFKNVLLMVRQIAEYLHDKSAEENLRKQWQRASQRLDLLLMIVFLTLNCIATLCILIIGYSNLRN